MEVLPSGEDLGGANKKQRVPNFLIKLNGFLPIVIPCQQVIEDYLPIPMDYCLGWKPITIGNDGRGIHAGTKKYEQTEKSKLVEIGKQPTGKHMQVNSTPATSFTTRRAHAIRCLRVCFFSRQTDR